MRQVFRIDGNKFFIEPVFVENNEKTPIDCVDVAPTEGLYKQKWNGQQWVEGLSQDEVNAIKNAPEPLTDIDQLRKQQADLTFTLMLNGVI